ncbi:hypothetical protein BDZ88DRAFT_437919 [Geranomyces variabilis]|nr:hypothetical protein BDZ88DRAFT_437919 [Geranomyces variabilis]KAJ3136836.1 hypothetical protein HDU90_002402 [Geranomyces variabilis]
MSGVKCDIIIVADATLSLHESLSSLKRILFESTLLSTLARSVDRFGAVLYGDYTAVDRYPVVRWSGWFQSHRGFSPFLEGGQLGPGGDPPEAVKTALSLVCDVVEASYPGKCDNGIPSQKRTLVIWHGDAPPHHPANQDGHPNYRRELSALGRDFDWIGLCKRARDLGVIAFPLIASGDRDTLSYFQCLAYMTGGCANVVANVGDGSTWTGLTLTMVLRYLGCGTDLLPCIKDDAARGLAWKQDPKRIFKAEVTENDAPGYLPSRKIANKKKSLLNLNVQAGSVVVSVIQLEIQGAISVPKASFKPGLSMKELRSAFSNDASFAARVLSVLTDLVSDIDALMTLTSSKLFSCLWREAVSVRSTAQTVLLSTFHKTLAGNVDQGKRATLKTWLEQGYDASDDIQQAISAIPVNSRFPALVFTGEITSIARPQDLTIISSTCKPTSLKKLIRFLHQIRIVRANDAQLIQRNVEARRQPLPVALPATHLVPMLPSLLFPGLMFSARASAVLAMILLVAGVAVKELVQKARLYLGLLKGTWLVTGMARNWSFGFLRLVKRLGDVMPLTEVFTPDEEESLIATLLIQGTFMNRRTDISLTVFFGGDGILLPDRKVPCTGGCNRSVSFTLHRRTRNLSDGFGNVPGAPHTTGSTHRRTQSEFPRVANRFVIIAARVAMVAFPRDAC